SHETRGIPSPPRKLLIQKLSCQLRAGVSHFEDLLFRLIFAFIKFLHTHCVFRGADAGIGCSLILSASPRGQRPLLLPRPLPSRHLPRSTIPAGNRTRGFSAPKAAVPLAARSPALSP